MTTFQWGRNLPVAEIRLYRAIQCPPTLISMGPQPSSRGNCFRARDGGFKPLISMGPQPSSRGNFKTTKKETNMEIFQWGRNLPVAEIPEVALIRALNRIFQWGRNLPVAEMSAFSAARWYSAGFQWGRNLPVAEISVCRSAWSLSLAFQWGRNLPVAEIIDRR